MTKWPVQKQTHRTAQTHARHQYAKDNTIFIDLFNDKYIRTRLPVSEKIPYVMSIIKIVNK